MQVHHRTCIFSIKFKFPIDYTCYTCYAVFVRRWNMKDRDLIKLLKKNGWQLDRINGSHHIFRKEGMTVSVPEHERQGSYQTLKEKWLAA